MVVENGTISYVGVESEAMQFEQPGTRYVDLKGRTVMPGFHDPHMHPLEASSSVGGTCTLYRDIWPEDPEQLATFTVDKCHLKQNGTDWVLGWGHSVRDLLDYVAETGKDPKDILDPLIRNAQGEPLPAIMMEFTSHSVWVNSEALRLAGITRDTPNEDGSVYMKNPVS